MSLVSTIVWLAVVGPLAGLTAAHFAGGLTWTRVLLWTAAGQMIAALLYVATQPMPVRVYGGLRPTVSDIVAMKGLFAVLVVALGLIIAACLTPIARWIVGGRAP